MAKLYRLNKGDREILRLGREVDPNFITDYYLRSDNSGTWWLPGAETDRWKDGYETIAEYWKSEGEPESFTFAHNEYQVRWQHEKSKLYPDSPAFFHNHGMLFIPYHKDLHYDRTPVRSVIGGFGSGKTLGVVMSMLVEAITLPGYRAFALAPESIQAEEVYRLAMQMMSGTEFEKRFLISSRQRPFPRIVLGHEEIGETTIECYPIANNEAKLRTLTGDRAVIDQAESPMLDLEELIRSVGTRFRGRVSRGGRERIGTITLIANAGDNQQLWDIYDEAEFNPEFYKSLSPSSYDNPYLTDNDLKRFEQQVGNNEEARQMYLFGKRPLGNGMHFSRNTLEKMRDKTMDEMMRLGIELQEQTGEDKGFIHLEAPKLGTYEWMLPYDPARQYLVISDPGTQNPPKRDSPPILVFDITDFPGSADDPSPAFLVGFVWVFGNNNIQNWAARYSEVVHRYNAIGTNGFDATGYQAGYDQWMNALIGLYPEKISLVGNKKSLCLNAAKVLTSAELIKAPAALSHLFSQLARYEYPPEPKRIRQDLVMAFIMACWWMQRLYWINQDPFEERPDYDPHDRYAPATFNRYGGNAR